MAVHVIDTIKPKNNLTFPVVEDIDVLIKASGARLSEVVANMATAEQIAALQTAIAGKASVESVESLTSLVNTKADAADLTALSATVEGKADAADLAALEAEVDTKADNSDLTTATANLQAQIDNIVSGSTADSEVINARIDENGNTYTTLKARLDAKDASFTSDVKKLEDTIDSTVGGVDLFSKGNVTTGQYWYYTGEAQESASWNTTDLMHVKTGETYHYSGIATVSNNARGIFTLQNGTFLSSFIIATGINSIEIPANAYFISFSVANTDLDTFTFTTPVKFDSEAINDNIDDLYDRAGKDVNLLNSNTLVIGKLPNWETGIPTDNATSSYFDQKIPCKKGDTIYLSNSYVNVYFYKEDDTFLSYSQITGKSKTITVDNVAYFIVGKQNSVDEDFLKTIMVNLNANVPPSYYPYGSLSLDTIETTKNRTDISTLTEQLKNYMDPEPTYIILDFDGAISSMSDNRVTLLTEDYNFPFTFVGETSPAVVAQLIGRGCDLSIYSNEAGYLPDVSTINSDSAEDIAAWDRYVKEAVDRYNAAGFFNQVAWSCQGMNYGSALGTALKKYGFKMARALNSDNGTIYTDSWTKNSFVFGTFQIYSDNLELTKTQINNAIQNKKDLCIFTHNIVDTSEEDRGYDCLKSTYTQFLTWLTGKVNSGDVKVVTFREYYKMHCPKESYEFDYTRTMNTIFHSMNLI